MNQAGDLPVGSERNLDLGAWSDERVSVNDEPVVDMGVEQRAPLLLLGAIGDVVDDRTFILTLHEPYGLVVADSVDGLKWG